MNIQRIKKSLKRLLSIFVTLFAVFLIGFCCVKFWYDYQEMKRDVEAEKKKSENILKELTFFESLSCDNGLVEKYLELEEYCKEKRNIVNQNTHYICTKNALNNLIETLIPVFTILKYALYLIVVLVIFFVLLLIKEFVSRIFSGNNNNNNNNNNQALKFWENFYWTNVNNLKKKNGVKIKDIT
jgi:hypothetical protein